MFFFLIQGEEIQLLDNRPILRFHADMRQQSGIYQCVAINGVGNPATAKIDLRILCMYTNFTFILSIRAYVMLLFLGPVSFYQN